MMRIIALLAASAIAGLAVSGCATSRSSSGSWLDPMEAMSPVYTGVATNAAESIDALRAAPVCCSKLSQVRFQPFDPKKTAYHEITTSSQAFDFSTGKSFLSALELPDNLDQATITLDAIAGATVFVPTVLILTEDFAVSRAIDSAQFEYVPAAFMQPQRLQGRFSIDRRYGSNIAREKYLVIFTTSEDLRGSTEMISEARLYARSRGLADPELPNPVAKHAATGVVRISTSDLEMTSVSSRQYVTQQQDARRYVEPAQAPARAPAARRAPTPVPAPLPPPAAPKAKRPTGGQQPMLSETQEMYDRMIRESVQSGDMDRAWRLVQEAERAGSPSARATFVQAVQQK